MKKSHWALKMVCGALCLASATLGTNAGASNYFVGMKVSDIGFFVGTGATGDSPYAFVEFSAAIPGSPGCVTSGWNKTLIFDTSTAKGKALLSVLTAAMLGGKTVEGRGIGSCNNTLNPVVSLTWGPGPSGGGTGAPVAVQAEVLQQVLVRN